jgi:DnaJ-class molecular chaperone
VSVCRRCNGYRRIIVVGEGGTEGIPRSQDGTCSMTHGRGIPVEESHFAPPRSLFSVACPDCTLFGVESDADAP